MSQAPVKALALAEGKKSPTFQGSDRHQSQQPSRSHACFRLPRRFGQQVSYSTYYGAPAARAETEPKFLSNVTNPTQELPEYIDAVVLYWLRLRACHEAFAETL